jgi:hypothetical protein
VNSGICGDGLTLTVMGETCPPHEGQFRTMTIRYPGSGTDSPEESAAQGLWSRAT